MSRRLFKERYIKAKSATVKSRFFDRLFCPVTGKTKIKRPRHIRPETNLRRDEGRGLKRSQNLNCKPHFTAVRK